MLSLRSAVKTRRIRSIGLKLAALGAVSAASPALPASSGCCPSEEVALDRNADGIVVLTGGTSRVTDALELLSSGRGKRLLITGVNPGTTTGDIAREVVNYDRAAGLLRRSRLFRAQHARQCGAGAALGARARLPFAHRRHLGLSHAARARRTVASASRRRADPVPGRFRSVAHRAVVVERRDDQAGAVGISQISCRQGAHAVRLVCGDSELPASADRAARRTFGSPTGPPCPDHSQFCSVRSCSTCCSMRT